MATPIPPPLPESRKRKRVTFRPPKAVGGAVIEGTVLDDLWTGPHCDAAWGYYAFFSEHIRWDGGGRSIRLSYYYWPKQRERWIFGGQYSLEGEPREMRDLLQKTLAQEEWFREDEKTPGEA